MCSLARFSRERLPLDCYPNNAAHVCNNGPHRLQNLNDVGVGNAIFAGASTIGASSSTGVFLANVEASAGWKVSPSTTMRGFVGANYDDKVPGITRPVFSGPVNGPTGLTPAGIFYAHETSYYAGGGVTVKFGGPVIAKY